MLKKWIFSTIYIYRKTKLRYTLKPKISRYRNGIWCAFYTLKVLSLLKKLDFINCSFLRDDVRNLAYGKKVNFWTKTDRLYFPRALHRSWWADQSICHTFFGRKIPSWDISVWKFKGVDNFSSKIHTETKNKPIQKWYMMCLLHFKSSLTAKEIRFYKLLLSKRWR